MIFFNNYFAPTKKYMPPPPPPPVLFFFLGCIVRFFFVFIAFLGVLLTQGVQKSDLKKSRKFSTAAKKTLTHLRQVTSLFFYIFCYHGAP
jgi:hypothetical protein